MHSPIKYETFSNWSSWPRNATITIRHKITLDRMTCYQNHSAIIIYLACIMSKKNSGNTIFVDCRDIGPAVRVFANGPGDLGSIPGRVIPKTLKMVLDTTLLKTQHYKVRFKGKVEQSWEWSSALPYTLV